MNDFLRKYIKSDVRRQMRDLLYWMIRPRDYFFCKIKGVKWHHSWIFYGLPIITQCRRDQIKIGKNFIACSKSKKNSIGVMQPVIIRAITSNAKIEIGDNTGLSGVSISARECVKIGQNCLIGSGVLITDNDAHPLVDRGNPEAMIKSSPVIIEDEVFIGARSIVLKGVRIGKGAVIGAGAVVTKDVEAGCMSGGNPAKILSKV